MGNVWALINPWKIVFEWAEGLYRRFGSSGGLSFHLPYPERLGMWPGVFLFLAFAWIELVYPQSADPSSIAIVVLLYSVITWGAMLFYGKDVWPAPR